MINTYIFHELVHVAAPVFLGFLAGFFGSYAILRSKCSVLLRLALIAVLLVAILFGSEFLHGLRADLTRLRQSRQSTPLYTQLSPNTYARYQTRDSQHIRLAA